MMRPLGAFCHASPGCVLRVQNEDLLRRLRATSVPLPAIPKFIWGVHFAVRENMTENGIITLDVMKSCAD